MDLMGGLNKGSAGMRYAAQTLRAAAVLWVGLHCAALSGHHGPQGSKTKTQRENAVSCLQGCNARAQTECLSGEREAHRRLPFLLGPHVGHVLSTSSMRLVCIVFCARSEGK